MQLIATLTHLAAEMQRTRAAQSSIRRILTKGVFQLKSPEAALARPWPRVCPRQYSSRLSRETKTRRQDLANTDLPSQV